MTPVIRPAAPHTPCSLCRGLRTWLHRAGSGGLWMCPICDRLTPPDEFNHIVKRRLGGDRDA